MYLLWFNALRALNRTWMGTKRRCATMSPSNRHATVVRGRTPGPAVPASKASRGIARGPNEFLPESLTVAVPCV